MKNTEKDRELLCAIFKALTHKAGQIIDSERDKTISRIVVSLPPRNLPQFGAAEGAFQLVVICDLDRKTTLPRILVEQDLYGVKSLLKSIAETRGTKHVHLSNTNDRGSESRDGSERLKSVFRKAADYFERFYDTSFEDAYDAGKRDILDIIGDCIAETVNDVVDYVDNADDEDIMNSRCTSGAMKKNGKVCKYENGLNVILKSVSRRGDVDYEIGISQDIIRAAKNDRMYD